MHLPTWGLRLPTTNKRKQLTPQTAVCLLGKSIISTPYSKTMQQAITSYRRERRLVLVVEIVEVSDREQEKTLWLIKI